MGTDKESERVGSVRRGRIVAENATVRFGSGVRVRSKGCLRGGNKMGEKKKRGWKRVLFGVAIVVFCLLGVAFLIWYLPFANLNKAEKVLFETRKSVFLRRIPFSCVICRG